VDGTLAIANNRQLCESVAVELGEQIMVGGIIEIHDNRDCNTVEQCGNGVYEGDYIITDEASLQGLSDYREVTGNLRIAETSFARIDGLECLAIVGGNLIIEGNEALTSMDFSSLTSVGGLDVYLNGSLETMNFSSLSSGDHIWIRENDSLTVVDFSSLTSVESVEPVGSVGWCIWISDNNVLESIDFNNISSVGGHLWIDGNESLTSIDFRNLSSAEGDLRIGSNDVLTSICFNNLSSVGNILWIIGNEALTSIGFNSLTSVGDGLCISENHLLNNIDGLGNLCTVANSFTITYNSQLCQSDAEALRNQVQNFGSIGGSITIHDNNCP